MAPDVALINLLLAAVAAVVEVDVGLAVGFTDIFAEVFGTPLVMALSKYSPSCISMMPGKGGARGEMTGDSMGVTVPLAGVTVPFAGNDGAAGDFGCPPGLTALAIFGEGVFATASKPMLLSSTSPTVLISAPDLRQRPAEPPQDCSTS